MTPLTRVILVRHGETEWNIDRRFQGHRDSPLTPEGIAQAKALGVRLAAGKIVAVYSSDLGRALHTARCIVESTGHPIATEPRLRERCLGVFEGLKEADIRARYPDEADRYYARDPHFAMTGGESAVGHFARCLEALHDLALRHAGQTTLVVTHGGTLTHMFRHVTGVALDAERRFSLKNAAYNCFIFENGRWTLDTWGDTSHYPDGAAAPVFSETSPEPKTSV
jgi:probable phosphoglycerate mutase